jgi:hypothetical protein
MAGACESTANRLRSTARQSKDHMTDVLTLRCINSLGADDTGESPGARTTATFP